MPLHFRCLCGVILNSPDDSAGRAAECPTCGKIIVIPQEAVSVALADMEAGPVGAPEPAAPPLEMSAFDTDEDLLFGGAAPEPESTPTQAGWPAFGSGPDESEVLNEPTLVINVDELGGRKPPGAPEPEPVDEGEEDEDEEPLVPIVPTMEDPGAEPVAEAAPEEDDGLVPLDEVEDAGPAIPASAEVVPAEAPPARAGRPGRRKTGAIRRSSGRRKAVGGAPRSKTTVARKRGQKALAALEAVDSGGDGSRARRSRRAPEKKGGAGKIVLIVVILLLVLLVGGGAALIFMPPGILPAGLQEKVDGIKEMLNLPVESAPQPDGEAPADAAGEDDAAE